MSVKDVNPLHRRYIELTARFKACWTFHRFQDGLQKFFGRRDLDIEPYDFQSLYKLLKAASMQINRSGGGAVEPELDSIEERLDQIVEALDGQDRKVSPSLVRRFFQRVKHHDERILIEMIRFYQETQRDRTWEADRIDKVDFLLSRLAERVAGPELERDRPRLLKILMRLSENVHLAGADSQKVANRVKLIQSVRSEMAEMGSFEEVTERDLVGHYRSLKHSLGKLYFEPTILPRVVDTNAALRNLIRRLSQNAAEAIFADYERIAELERDGQMHEEVADAVHRLHLQVDRFRKTVQSGDLRLGEVAEMRRTLDGIDGLIEAGVDWITEREPPSPEEEVRESAEHAFELQELFTSVEARRLIAPFLREIVDALAGAGDDSPDQSVASAAAVALRLEPREVVAYRRLSNSAECDQRLESFLLTAAALRHRINSMVGELHSVTSARPGVPVSTPGWDQRTLVMADWYLKQFTHFLEAALLAEEPGLALDIQRCCMHLMRDYSGLWLEVHRLIPDS